MYLHKFCMCWDITIIEIVLCLSNMDMSHILGAMVNISSIASTRGLATIFYGASKAALDQITRCMAVELGPHNIRVNGVNPTMVENTSMTQDILRNTDEETVASFDQMIPLKRRAKTEEVVNTVLYLLSDKADLINGSFLTIDGGQSCT